MRAAIYLIMPIAILGSLLAISVPQVLPPPPNQAVAIAPSGTQATRPQKDVQSTGTPPSLQSLLSPIYKLLDNKEYASALPFCDTALKAAQTAKDRVGEARARRLGAIALQGLKRFKEACDAWLSAAALWHEFNAVPEQVEALASASVLLTNNHPDEAKKLIQQVITLARTETKRQLDVARYLTNVANRALDRGQTAMIPSLLEVALPIFERLDPDSQDRVYCLDRLGSFALDCREFDAAHKYYIDALTVQDKIDPLTLNKAAILHNLGVIALRQNDFDTEEYYFKLEWEIQDKLEPWSLDVANSLNNLGNLASRRHAFTEAERDFLSSLAIRDKLVPGSLDVADSLNNLGANAYDRGNLAEAIHYEKLALAIREKQKPHSLIVAHSFHNLGMDTYAQGDLTAAEYYHKHAFDLQMELAPGTPELAASLNGLGNVAWSRDDLPAANDYYQRALGIVNTIKPRSLEAATIWNNLGNVDEALYDFNMAENCYKQALEIREVLVSGTLDVAQSLEGLGDVAHDRGDADSAETFYQKALTIREDLAPNSILVASSLIALGNVCENRNNFNESQSYYTCALGILKEIAPESPEMALVFANMGNIENDLGHYESANEYFHQAKQILKEALSQASELTRTASVRPGTAPGSRDSVNPIATYGQVFMGMGNAAFSRGDYEAAQINYEEALHFFEKISPRSMPVAAAKNNLASLFLARADYANAHNDSKARDEDYARAREYNMSALAMQQAIRHGTLDEATSLFNLGIVAFKTNHPKSARQYYQQAKLLLQRHQPHSLEVAIVLDSLGTVATAQHQYSEADGLFQQAQNIFKKLASESLDRAFSLVNWSTNALLMGNRKQAKSLAISAVNIVETQRRQIMRTEGRGLLVEIYSDAYTALMRSYLALHQDKDAYETLERARGRSLADSLFESHRKDLREQVSPNLLIKQSELYGRRSMLLKQRQLLDQKAPEYKRIDAVIQQSQVEIHQLEEEIRRAAPHYAALHYPKSIDLKTVQCTLDRGTLLLEFTIDEHAIYLFAITNNSFRRYTLPTKRQDLLFDIQNLSVSFASDTADSRPDLLVKLYNLLLGPARKEIESAQRLLVCPDRQMWQIPFCALIDNNNAAEPHFLIESKPLSYTFSMNVYAQIINNRHRVRRATHPLLAFGDPAYRSEGNFKAPVGRSTGKGNALNVLDGPEFGRVPITGDLVRGIGDLYGLKAKSKQIHVDGRATVSAVFQEAGSARRIHFSHHAFFNKLDPLASFLALSPERDDKQYGMLTAYDVMARLHLDADLVTLGACSTGTGTSHNTSAEGVMGLTWAFQYAGAQSVLATQWEINPDYSSIFFIGLDPQNATKKVSNEALQKSFYGALHGPNSEGKESDTGHSKAVALQLAQIALIHSPEKRNANASARQTLKHDQPSLYLKPYYWAAYYLQGDWQ